MNKKQDIAVIERKIYSKILRSENGKKIKPRHVNITRNDKLLAASIIFIILLFAFGFMYYYNVFINLTYNIEANQAQIDTQVQKRKNLIINLGTTVIEYTRHEREVFTYLAELRAASRQRNPENPPDLQEELAGAENQDILDLGEGALSLETALSKLTAVAEQYPDLKLSENFRKYMDAILEFENRIAELRIIYNDSVNEYSTIKDQFPGKIFSLIMRFDNYVYFRYEIDETDFIEVGK